MARSIRLDYPNSFYHVLSRGNEKRKIFLDSRDNERFLYLLDKVVERFQIEIHAYVLMENHYHLLIKTREANLSRAIQWLGVSYAVWFNSKHSRVGHLFQGRFKSFLVENEEYFTALCYYIHGNPLRAGITEDIKKYDWSSCKAYSNLKYKPRWLKMDLILSMNNNSSKLFCKRQKQCLNLKSNLLEDLRYGLYLGSEKFAATCKERIRNEDIREKPQKRNILKKSNPKDLALNVLKDLGEKYPEVLLTSMRKQKRPNRDIAIYIMAHLGIYTNKEIGEIFGVGYTAITGSVKRGEQYLLQNKKIKNIAEKIINDI